MVLARALPFVWFLDSVQLRRRDTHMSARRRPVLVFDADGVVITPPHRFMAYMQNILHVRREDSDAFFRGAFIDCLLGRADLKESIAPFLPRWGWKGSVDALLQCWFNVENNVNHELVPLSSLCATKGTSAPSPPIRRGTASATCDTRCGSTVYSTPSLDRRTSGP